MNARLSGAIAISFMWIACAAVAYLLNNPDTMGIALFGTVVIALFGT